MSKNEYRKVFKKVFTAVISEMGLENHKKMSVFGPTELDIQRYKLSKKKAHHNHNLKKAS